MSPINLSRGAMYPDVDGTVNFIKGKCVADCVYCFMKYGFRAGMKSYEGPYTLVQKEFDTFDAEPRSRIFCGSATDIWQAPNTYIREVLEFCIKQEEENEIEWLFQTKFPVAVPRYVQLLPRNCMVGVTLETNRVYEQYISKAPDPVVRAYAMKQLLDLWTKWVVHKQLPDSYLPRIMVSIEPIMEFDLEPFVEMIQTLEPEYVSIGMDTQNAFREHDIRIPSLSDVCLLLSHLGRITEVKVKPNLLSLADSFYGRGQFANVIEEIPGVTLLHRRKRDEN